MFLSTKRISGPGVVPLIRITSGFVIHDWVNGSFVTRRIKSGEKDESCNIGIVELMDVLSGKTNETKALNLVCSPPIR